MIYLQTMLYAESLRKQDKMWVFFLNVFKIQKVNIAVSTSVYTELIQRQKQKV